MRLWLVVAGLLTGSVLWSSCGGSGDSAQKIVITENVCAGADFLRMNLGEETKIVLDNSKHVEIQTGMSAYFQEFPVVVIGELPEASQVGSTFTSFRLFTEPGEEDSVTVRPLFTGDYAAQCNLTIDDNSGGGTSLQYQLKFQIVDK